MDSVGARGARAASFDFGQTLAELDHEFLASRALALGAWLDTDGARAATVMAWQRYGAAKSEGHERAWREMMLELLRGGRARPVLGPPRPGFVEALAEELWLAQPSSNLWRKPITGMFELAAELSLRQVPTGIISNSEGRLAELVQELGQSAIFPVVVDSGRLGIDKPDRRIFEYAAALLGVPLSAVVHVGDSWEADVMGALGAGARAIWFAPTDGRAMPPGVVACHHAGEVRNALQTLGLLRS